MVVVAGLAVDARLFMHARGVARQCHDFAQRFQRGDDGGPVRLQAHGAQQGAIGQRQARMRGDQLAFGNAQFLGDVAVAGLLFAAQAGKFAGDQFGIANGERARHGVSFQGEHWLACGGLAGGGGILQSIINENHSQSRFYVQKKAPRQETRRGAKETDRYSRSVQENRIRRWPARPAWPRPWVRDAAPARRRRPAPWRHPAIACR